MTQEETQQAVANLNEDIQNEYKHMGFYMQTANTIIGLPRIYLAPKLQEHAASEMGHVNEFAHKIRGYGGWPLSVQHCNTFPTQLCEAKEILQYAIEMEREVVANYQDRLKWVEGLDEPDVSLVVFYEDQIEDSQKDIDELRQILEGLL